MKDIIGPAHPNYSDRHAPLDTIIGISGYARAGKDTVADILVDTYGFTKFSFADHLRDCLYVLNPIVMGIFPSDHPTTPGKAQYLDLHTVIDTYGWTGYKDSIFGPHIRELLQRMGTEVGREMIADDIWVSQLDKHSGRIVIPDVRFPNEFEKVKSSGGRVLRIERTGTKPTNNHPSETSLDHYTFDQVIYNDRDLWWLREYVDLLMSRYNILPVVL